MKRETRFSAKANTCGICLALIEFSGSLNCCSHKFCFDCILKWSQVLITQTENRCPVCKGRFSSVTRISHRVEYKDAAQSGVVDISEKSQGSSFSFSQLSNSSERLFEGTIEVLMST